MKNKILYQLVWGAALLFLGGVVIYYLNNPWNFLGPVVYPDDRFILFSAKKGSMSHIFRAPVSGGVAEQLTKGISVRHFGPSISRDQKVIVFSSVNNGASNLFLVSSDGGKYVQLTDGPTNDINAVISPDGKWVYFVRGARYISPGGGWVDYDLYSLELATKNMQRITHRKCFSISRPSISPDGQTLLVAMACGERDQLWKFPVDGSNEGQPLRPVFGDSNSTNCDECMEPQYSQDGKLILFVKPNRTPAYTGDNIVIADSKTLSVNRVIRTGLYVSKPAFAPDSQTIIFSASRDPSRRDTRHELWLANQNGIYEIPLEGFGPLLWMRSMLGI